MEVIFAHEITFTNKETVSVSDVANSLLANEQILSSVGEILERCFDGLIIEKINIKFISATTNSPLKEALSAGILIAFQDTLKREVPFMIEKITGAHVPDEYRTIVTIVFLVVVIYGIEKAWDIFINSKRDTQKQESNPQIFNNYGTVVNAGGALMSIPPDQLSAAVHAAFPPKKVPHLAKAALAFIQPAKREKGTTITGGGLSIEAATIEEAPSALDIAMDDDDETQTTFKEAEVVIHATDIDHHATGWAGHLPGKWEKRLKMKLFPTIRPDQIFGKDRMVADIMVISKRQLDGSYMPYLFHVLRVYD